MNILSQTDKENFVEITGVVEDIDGNPIPGAIVKLMENNTVLHSIRSNQHGEFQFFVDYNHYYIIEISKAGMVNKRIAYDTKMPGGTTGYYGVGNPIFLFEGCEGVETSIMDDPVVIISYNAKRNDFEADESYAARMSSKISRLTANIEDCKQKAYREIIKKADDLYKQKEYADAIETYKEALKEKPGDNYANRKIAEINQILTKENQNERLYEVNIKEGDKYFDAGNYPLAKNYYQRSLLYKPNAEYPTNKINEIDQIIAQKETDNEQDILLAQQNAKNEAFNKLIAQADAHFNNKNYNGAKSLYNQALNLKPGDPYPTNKIAEINRIIAEQQQLTMQEKAKEEEYNKVIAKADQYFANKDYNNAKAAYQKALTYKPNETYPNTKIAEINQIIATRQQLDAQERAKETAYNREIHNADQLFQNNNYEEAKAAYQKALAIKPGESYPTAKIAEIDRIIAEQERLANQAKAQEERYNKAVAQGDQYLNSGNYSAAKSSYQQALTSKPGAYYPTQKIKEIENIEAQNRLDQQYQQFIATADNYFNNKNYEQAKAEYAKASQIKPDERYPKEKINEINDIITAQEEAALAEKRKKEQFDKLITLADTYFKKKDYQNAQKEYKKALQIFPNAPYPKQKIKDIENLLKQQARAKPTVKKGPALTDLKFANKDEEEKYLDELKRKYPEGVTLEIYKGTRKTVKRYIVIRDGVANEFRQAIFSWGSEYTINGRDITSQYFNQQTETREGEYFNSFEIQP